MGVPTISLQFRKGGKGDRRSKGDSRSRFSMALEMWPDNRATVPLSLYSSARGLSRRDIVRLIRTFAAETRAAFILSLTVGMNGTR